MSISLGVVAPDMSVGGPAIPVNLREEFSKGAAGAAQETLAVGVSDSQRVVRSSSIADPQRVEQAVEEIATFARNLGRSLSISVDESSGEYVVQVQNAETSEVVRQIPSEEVLKISEMLKERNQALTLMGERGAGGLFLDFSV